MKKMKRIIFSLAFTLVSLTTFAQLDRSVMPKPGPEREIEIGEAKTFELKNGLTVIVVNNEKLPRVTYSLIMDRTPMDEGNKAGVADLLGEMLTEGTSKYTKEELDEEVDFMGARLSASSSSAFASGLSKYKENLIALLAEVVRNATFPQESFDKLMKQSESGIESSKDDPNSISGNLVRTVLYGNDHPYGQFMTQESIENITLDDVKSMYAKRFSPTKTYIAIVGDISKKEAKKLVKKYFGDWEASPVEEIVPAFPKTTEVNTVHIVDRPSSVQSIIAITHVIDLKPATEDVMAMRVMDQILGGGSTGRLFKNLREDKGFTYGSYSDFSTDRYVGRFSATAEVRNEVTDSSVTEILKELKRIVNEPVTDEEIKAAKEGLKGSFGRSLERPGTIANFALCTLRYNLPDDHYENYLIRLDAVSKADVQRVAKKYIQSSGFHITVVGKSSEIADKLSNFGEIIYHDFEGNITDAPVQLPEGVTASSIIEDYIEALGGRESISAVQNVKISREGTIQGMTLKSQEIYSGRDKAYMLQDMGPMGKIEMTKNGVEVAMKQNGQAIPLPDDQKASLQASLQWIPELDYATKGVELKATGMSEVNGRPAYVVEVKDGEEMSTEFFDIETGLKLRSQEMADAPDGSQVAQNTDYLNYVEKGGISFAEKIKVPLGPGMTMEFELKEVLFDQELDKQIFN
jgi:predicted Zn-dependent peptidase